MLMLARSVCPMLATAEKVATEEKKKRRIELESLFLARCTVHLFGPCFNIITVLAFSATVVPVPMHAQPAGDII
jgi:hypothetical protein